MKRLVKSASVMQLPHKAQVQSGRCNAGPLPTHRTQTAPRQMTLADQWSKITSVLVRSVEGASAVKDMQSAATQQLDLAQYGLSTLVDELAAVMAMPGVSSSRRAKSATVHALGSNIDASDPVLAAAKSRALAA